MTVFRGGHPSREFLVCRIPPLQNRRVKRVSMQNRPSEWLERPMDDIAEKQVLRSTFVSVGPRTTCSVMTSENMRNLNSCSVRSGRCMLRWQIEQSPWVDRFATFPLPQVFIFPNV